MTDIALPGSIEPARERGPKLDHATNPMQLILFFGVLAAGVAVAVSIAFSIDGCIWLGAACYLPLGAVAIAFTHAPAHRAKHCSA